ncbi:hypothetical protein EVAR_86701_1 [Eumeta japonica]|uniref:Uncharacterized protein n=1 Tax=Eumeta variegata TaxID=151549 RepID=A0A4C1XYU5_EUMVA|nr:hypothetical protein EVAR_86701_1 [Eumeta japonica]
MVHLAHVPMVMYVSFPSNPRFVEQTMRGPIGKFLSYHGNAVIQTFVYVANFLTAYKFLVFSEKYKMNFSLMPKLIIDRIIRMHPMHLTTVGIMATIFVHLNDGPLWYKYVGSEATKCRELWWHHLFFVHNSCYWADCVPQSWCLPQLGTRSTWQELTVKHNPGMVPRTFSISQGRTLYLLCSIIMLWIISRGLDPEYVLKRLLAASLLLLFAIVYLFELRPQLLTSNPENILSLFAEDASHVHLYMSAWGNMPTAILGLLIASIYYRLQKEKIDLTENKVRSRDEHPVLARLAGAQPAVFQLVADTRYGQRFADVIAVGVISYLLALPLALLIEYPAVQLYKAAVESSSGKETEKDTSVKSKRS